MGTAAAALTTAAAESIGGSIAPKTEKEMTFSIGEGFYRISFIPVVGLLNTLPEPSPRHRQLIGVRNQSDVSDSRFPFRPESD